MKIIIVRQMIRNVCKYIFYIWEDSEGVNSHSGVKSKPKELYCNHQTDTKTTKLLTSNLLYNDNNSVDNFTVTRHDLTRLATTQANTRF